MTIHTLLLFKDIILALFKEDEAIRVKLLAVIDEIEIDLKTED